MSLENLRFSEETTVKDVLVALREEVSSNSLPVALTKAVFSRPTTGKIDQLGFRSVARTDEIPWISHWETWKDGGRIVNAYPWALSVTMTEGENTKRLIIKKDKVFFSGTMAILDFNKMLREVISEKGKGFGLVNAESVAQELAENIAVNQASVDFSKISVAFEFKFSKAGYEVVKAQIV